MVEQTCTNADEIKAMSNSIPFMMFAPINLYELCSLWALIVNLIFIRVDLNFNYTLNFMSVKSKIDRGLCEANEQGTQV